MVALVATATLAGCPPKVDTVHTQEFAAGQIDLEGKQLYYQPKGDSYSRTVTDGVTDFKVLPAGHTVIDFSNATSVEVPLGGAQIEYFGNLYSQLFVGSDGTVAFGAAGTGNASLEAHFSANQISLLPVDATASGEVSYGVFTDSVVVTFDAVDGSSFQGEFFIAGDMDRDIAISYPVVDAGAAGVVGLSNGQLVGLDAAAIASFLETFENSDLGTTNTGT